MRQITCNMKHKYSQIAANIKDIRLSKGCEHEDLADVLDIGVRAYQNIENGTTDISYSKLEKIAAFFGMEVTEIATWHQRPVVNNIHQPQHNFIVVNHGTVESEAAHLHTELSSVKAKLAALEQQIAEIFGR